MSQRASRLVLMVVAVSGLATACAGDQKGPESADAAAAEEAPVMTTTPPSGNENTTPPTGQPAGLPRAEPPPQGLNSSPPSNALATPAPDARAGAQATLTEGQIAKVSDLVNTAEIEQGKLAQNKAKSPRVKAFAAKMVKHHQQAKTEQARLVKQLDITPADSADATALKTDSEATLKTLRQTSAGDFDAAYLESQVTAHEKVLATIDEQLLPSAKTADVIRALQVAREAVASHLAEAKTLQGELANGATK